MVDKRKFGYKTAYNCVDDDLYDVALGYSGLKRKCSHERNMRSIFKSIKKLSWDEKIELIVKAMEKGK